MSSFDFGHRMTSWQPIFWIQGTVIGYYFGDYSDMATVDICFENSNSVLKIFGDHPCFSYIVENLAPGIRVKITGIYIPQIKIKTNLI